MFATPRPCNPKALETLEARGLSVEVATEMGLFTARRPPKPADETVEYDKTPIPDVNGSILCYPYFGVDGSLINTKHVARTPKGKLYFQTPGATKIFYNLPATQLPELYEDDAPALVIVEGENDVLALKTAGYPYVVSVPDGGSPAFDEKGRPIPMKPDNELDPTNDVKFEYIGNCWPQLEKIKRIIIWTDWDDVGQRLKEELARRLGKVRCAFVTNPHANESVVHEEKAIKGATEPLKISRCVKDANEVLQHYGPEAVISIIQHYKMMPVTGLYTLDDFEEKPRVLYSTGLKALDPILQMYPGSFTVSSGLPGSGKSQLWNQIAYNMAAIHGWRICIASFEADIKPDIQRQLRAFFIAKDRREWTRDDVRNADDWIREHFVFITRDPSGIHDVIATPEWLVERFEEAVIRYGIRMTLTDPWNQLDHIRRPGEMRDEYLISRIKIIKDFAKRTDTSSVIVAHPDKAAGREAQKGGIMSMYDITDGAGWVNAAEHGVIVYRKSLNDTMTEVYARKIKFRGTGRVGSAILVFDESAELFDTRLVPLTPDPMDARGFGQ